MKFNSMYIYLVLVGGAAGLFNGIIGTGGGIVIVFALALLFPALSPKDRFACAAAVIIPTSLLSAFLLSGSLPPIATQLAFLIPAVPGGILGALLLDRISVLAIKRIFALLTIYAGVMMILR